MEFGELKFGEMEFGELEGHRRRKVCVELEPLKLLLSTVTLDLPQII